MPDIGGNSREPGTSKGNNMQDAPSTTALSRRSLLTGAVALGLSAVAAESALSPAVATAENRYTLDGWRFCVNCFGLFLYDWSVDRSICPRTNQPHQVAGWTFRLTYNLSSSGTGESANIQSNWRHCFRCSALYWGPSAASRCPAGGAHGYIWPGGYPRQFLLPHDIGESAWTQHQWRFCFKCAALFYNGYAYKGEYGLCPYDRIYGHAYIMRDTTSIIVLSVVAIILVLGIGLFIAINPWVAVGLAPILVAISVIIREIGRSSGPSDNNLTR